MATAPTRRTTSVRHALSDDYPSCVLPFRASGLPALEASEAPTGAGRDPRVERVDLQRELFENWRAALARGDDAEVDRLVRQSRIERVWAAASGPLDAMLGHPGQIPNYDNILPLSTAVSISARTARR